MSEPEKYLKDMWNLGIHAYIAVDATIHCRLIPYETQCLLAKQTKRWYTALQNCLLIGDINLNHDGDFNADFTDNPVMPESDCCESDHDDDDDNDRDDPQDNCEGDQLETKSVDSVDVMNVDKNQDTSDINNNNEDADDDDDILGSSHSHSLLMDQMFPGSCGHSDWYDMSLAQAEHIKHQRENGNIYIYDFVPAGVYNDPYFIPSLKFISPDKVPYLI